MDFNLDFSIETTQDRTIFIKEMIKKFPNLTKSELELCSNYILYGKDEKSGFSDVDLKKIYIKPKYNSYTKTEPISLDELLESPTFSETMFQNNKHLYKKEKITIDRKTDSNILGMKELWANIDRVQKIMDVNEGKIDNDGTVPTLSEKELYQYKHFLIELKKQQYFLKDNNTSTFIKKMNKGQWFNSPSSTQGNFNILPRGVMRAEKDSIFENPYMSPYKDENQPFYKYYFDFTNKDHVCHLILFYEELKDMVKDTPDSIIWNLLWTLDFYSRKANFSQQEQLIYELKKYRTNNREIANELERQLNIKHGENYISTIWRNKVCGGIAAAAELNYDEYMMRNKVNNWKQCNTCGRILLRDKRNFVQKAQSLDGLTGRCKVCDKIKRQQRGEDDGK